MPLASGRDTPLKNGVEGLKQISSVSFIFEQTQEISTLSREYQRICCNFTLYSCFEQELVNRYKKITCKLNLTKISKAIRHSLKMFLEILEDYPMYEPELSERIKVLAVARKYIFGLAVSFGADVLRMNNQLMKNAMINFTEL
jgi:hypothetical protein